MNYKYSFILFVTVLLLFTIGCKRSENDLEEAPFINVEATVSSLYLDNLNSDCRSPEVCPRDRVTIRIDKIDRTDDPNNVINLNVGDSLEFNLIYSARPAKLRKDIEGVCDQGKVLKSGSCIDEGCYGFECSVSSPNYNEKSAELEDDFIIYHLPKKTDSISEKILPGLNEGSKIKITIVGFVLPQIGEYEIIS